MAMSDNRTTREVVARKLFDLYAEELGRGHGRYGDLAEWDSESSMSQDDWLKDADAILYALAPIIVAEIQQVALDALDAVPEGAEPYKQGQRDRLVWLNIWAAKRLASRICGGDHE
jgi:hypothetical protein